MIAYLVLVHKNPGQVARLIDRLTYKKSMFFVHVDAKSEGVFEPLQERYAHSPHVRFTKRLRVDWGAPHRALMLAMRDAITIDPDFVVTISGQDYPICSSEEIEQFFVAHAGRSFVEFVPLDEPGLDLAGRDRVNTWWFRYRGHYFPVPGTKAFRRQSLSFAWNNTIGRVRIRRRFLRGMHPYGGSAWWCLSGERARRTIDYLDAHPEFLRFYDRAFIPDEQFMQTLVANDQHEDVVNSNLHFIEWERGDHPVTLSVTHLLPMLGSGRLFARKFDVDSEVLDELDAHAGTGE